VGALVWRVLGTGSAIAAATLARNGLQAVWRKSTGKEPPANPLSPRVTAGEALSWAIVSGAIVQVARMLATRQAAKFYEKSAGHLPKKLQDVS
jgi:hypothetical protein